DSIKVIKNFFYITNINNTGAAFGILQDGGIIFIILSIIALVGLIRYVIIDKNIVKLEAISYALVLGGILGNFIDRIMYGYIIDYLDFYFFGYNFPVFNLADMCMVIGFMIIIFNMFISKGETNEINISRRKK
ncbi:MAG: signal peptidase II, partial [Bacilli bacterium]|nr:signal peptidase II [Bacilli bacterium]